MDSTPPMPGIFRYFWFIAAAFMLVNIAIWRSRIGAVVSRGVVTRADADRFIFWLAVWLVGVPLVMGVVAIAAGWSSPFCAGMFMFDSVPRALSSGLTLACYAALLWWVWRGTGAEFLSHVAPALGRRSSNDKQYSPAAVRAVVTAVVVISSVGGVIMWRTMPPLQGIECATRGAR
jgi:hypothetical protein